MRIDAVRRAPHDIDVPAIGLPSRLARGIVVVGVLNAPIVLFAVLVFGRIRIGIAALPEVLNKGFALFVVAQAHERFAFFVRNNVGHFLVQPCLVGALQLLPQFFLLLVSFLV